MSRILKQWLKNYFEFSKGDRNAIIILIILILLTITANRIVVYFSNNTTTDFSEFEKVMEVLENNHQDDNEITQVFFPFNPNTATQNEIDSLSIPDFVKKNILRYRDAGGRFKNKTDVAKIYGMTDSIYSLIEDYIVIDNHSAPNSTFEKADLEVNETQNNESYEKEKKSTDYEKVRIDYTIELNSADSTELVKLNGIGPVYASRIIKYRKLLGGFYSGSQLLEVYNFPEETYQTIKNRLVVDTTQITKIRLNFAGYIELIRHPYLEKEHVQSILNYRDKNGPFDTVEQIYSVNLVDSVTFYRLKPYLSSR
jgi:DNA uptake protein ComE-like DNA-binding protein